MASEARNTEREDRILNSSAQLIARYGFDKTTMEDIAREAGVSKGALYLHFKSKDDLFDVLLLRESERMSERILERIVADPQGGTIFSIFAHSLNAVGESPLLRALYTQDRRLLGDYMRKLRDTRMYTGGFSFGTEFVQQMQAAGLIRQDIRADVITFILIMLRYGLFTVEEAISIQDPPPIEDVSAVVAEMLDKAFAPEGGDSEAGKRAFMQLIEHGKGILADIRARKGAPQD
jgi:TetR/AcrR family acrAB operon transcriptional repressor